MSGRITKGRIMREALPTAGELAFAALMTSILLCACASLIGGGAP